MPKTTVSGIKLAAVAASLLYGAILNAQPTDKAPAAPVPVQIINAKKVFVSNAGADGLALATFERRAPRREAELVFEIRFGAPLTGSDKMDTDSPQYGVTILDTKTHSILWTLAEPVDGAFRKTTFIRNLDQAMDRVMNDLKALAGEPSVAIPETHN